MLSFKGAPIFLLKLRLGEIAVGFRDKLALMKKPEKSLFHQNKAKRMSIKTRSCFSLFGEKMLSKTEQEILRNPSSFNSNYQRSLRCRLKVKAEKMRIELSLLNATENCSGVAEFCSVEQSHNQDHSMNQGQIGAFGGIWTRDHYLTKVTPHRARLRRRFSFSS